MHRDGITLQQSEAIKGLGILLLLFYHLFSQQRRIDEFQLSGLFPGMPVVTAACHCGLALFIFATAYGLTVQEKDRPFQWKRYLAGSLARYRKLIINLCYVFVVLVFISEVFSLPYTVITVWGDNLLDCVKGSLATVTGTAGLFGIRWFSPAWWYMKLAVLLLFLVPLLAWLVHRLPPVLVLTVTLIGIPLAGFSTTQDRLPRYMIVVVLSVLAAEKNWIGRTWDYFADKKWQRTLFMTVLAGLIAALVYARLFFTQTYLLEAATTLSSAFLVVFVCRVVPPLTTVLGFWGRYSMYMWWIHPFLLGHWFESFIYSFGNIWLIFAVLSVLSLLVSVLLAKLKQWVLGWMPQSFPGGMTASWMPALATGSLCVLVTVGTASMGYLSNDDGGIQNLLAGNVTGEPYITHQFINVLLGAFISFLYRVLPGIQWWYWYSLAVFLVGMYAIHLCFFIQGKRHGLKLAVPLAFVAALDLVFLAYAMANIAFTIVPAVLGSGLVAVVMLARPIRKRNQQVAAAVITVVVYVMVLVHRRDTGIALVCYILLAILYHLTRKTRKISKLAAQFAVVCVCFGLITGGVIGFNNTINVQINGTEFVEYNRARGAYMDYPKESYSENPQLYQQVGWDEDVATLVSSWCFIDENVTADSFRYLSENSRKSSENPVSQLASFLVDERCVAMLILGAASLVAAGFCLIRQFDKRFLFFFLANNGGTLLLLLYQTITGRILYRSAIVVLLPCFVINMFLTLGHFSFRAKEKAHFAFWSALLAVVLVVSAQFFVFDSSRNVYKENAWKASRQVESYVIDHPDNVYICTTGVYNALDPWTVYTDQKPTNIIPWGGSAYGSDNYIRRLQLNGLTNLNADTFLLDNVRFMITVNATSAENAGQEGIFYHLFRYLKNRTDMIGFVLEDQLSNSVYVYRFISAENKDDYDSYYVITDEGYLQLCM